MWNFPKNAIIVILFSVIWLKMVIGPERPRSYGPTPEKDGPVRLSVGPRSFGPVSHIIRPSVFLRTAVFLRPIGLFSFFLQINNFFSLTLLGIALFYK